MKLKFLTIPVVCFIVSILAFLIFPSSILLYICTLPYSIWAMWHLKKHQIGLLIIGVLMLISLTIVLVILPLVDLFANISLISDFVTAMFPHSYFYNWIQEPPQIIYLNLALVFILVLFTEGVFFVIHKIRPTVQHRKAQMLIMSSLMSWISFVYLLFSYIAILVPVLMIFLEQYVIYTVVYDFLFKLLPFITFYFVIRYVFSGILRFFGL